MGIPLIASFRSFCFNFFLGFFSFFFKFVVFSLRSSRLRSFNVRDNRKKDEGCSTFFGFGHYCDSQRRGRPFSGRSNGRGCRWDGNEQPEEPEECSKGSKKGRSAVRYLPFLL